MIILHIASISNNKCDGVCVAVPQHVKAQENNNIVGFININNDRINEIDNNIQIKYTNKFNINNIKEPFNKPDIVIFHGCYRIEYLKIAGNLKKNRIPYIIIPHGELRKEAQGKKKFKKIVANIFLFNTFIKNSIGLQCLSKNEYDNTYFENKKKFIATNGVDIPSVRKDTFNKDRINFAYIGRLEVYVKGIDLMIKAINRSAELMRKNNCTLDIYGPDIYGRYKKVEELIINNNVEDIIKLHHEVTGEEKEKILLKTDVFIQTSRHEGMPLGVLEALSYGIPALVTKGTNLGMIIEKNQAGWYANNSYESIAERIDEVIKDKMKFKDYGKNAVELIKKDFNWENIGKETVSKYNQMIK